MNGPSRPAASPVPRPPSRRRFPVPLALALAATLAACRHPVPAARIVAVVVDLSGPSRGAGADARDGARLAFRDAAPGRRSGIQLLVQDDRGDLQRAVRLAGYLRKLPEVLAVIGPAALENAGPALAEYGRDGGIPVLVPLSPAPDLAAARGWAFALAPTADYLGESLAWFLVTELRGDSAATFAAREPAARALESGFLAELGRLGGGVIMRAPPAGDAGRLPEAARRARAVLVAERPVPAAASIARLRQSGIAVPVLTGAAPELAALAAGPEREAVSTGPDREASTGPDSAATASSPDDVLAGVYYPLLFDRASSPSARAFAERFQAAYGRAPTETAALAYDAVGLVLEASGAGARDRDGLRAWLEGGERGADHVGVAGRFFFSKDHAAVREVAIASRGAVAARASAARSGSAPR